MDTSDKLRMDIIERKKVEEKLRKVEEEWQRTFDAMVDPIMILDTSHRIIKANKAMADKLGVAPSEAEGLTCYKSVHGTNEPPPFCPHAELLDDGQPHAVEIEEPRLGGYLLVSVSPIRDSEGKLCASIHYARDITERKNAEEALRESEQRFRAIFDSAGDGILLADPENRNFSLGNKWICKMLGYAPDEIKNLSVRDIHPTEHLPYVSEQFERMAREDITLAKDIPVKRKDGSVFYADIRSSSLTLAGKMCLMGIFRDVTERKQADAELHRRLDELERFTKETIQREFRVRELKDKVARLEEELRKKA
ncbi:MAG: PAS domain S-box protein [Nitrospirae bacterium]|nr:PAS domain S-box protein [Nitrospirota bacterium]